MHNDAQPGQCVEFYRVANDYFNARDALRHLILTFLCWELHFTGHAHSKQSSPRRWCYKHRLLEEVTCGLGYILLINSTVSVPRDREIRALTRGHPAYAQAQDAWRQLEPFIPLAHERAATIKQLADAAKLGKRLKKKTPTRSSTTRRKSPTTSKPKPTMTTEERAQRSRDAAARGIRDFTEPTSDDSDYDEDDDEARDEGRDTATPASDDADERFFPTFGLTGYASRQADQI